MTLSVTRAGGAAMLRASSKEFTKPRRQLNGNVTEKNCKQHNGGARALEFLVHFLTVLYKTTTCNDQILPTSGERESRRLIFGIFLSTEVIAVFRI